MKVLVAIKRVIDYQVKVRVLADESGVEMQNVKMSINPFDEIALEEAMRLKEQGIASEVVVVTVGPQAAQESLRTALAFGADKAILVTVDVDYYPLNIAKILQQVVLREAPECVILGKQAIDNDCNQTGQMLAALLNWSQATFVSQLQVDGQQLTVVREVDGGLETNHLNLPAIITTDLRLNEPRYITLPNIMKAKAKPLDVLSLADLQLNLTPNIKIKKISKPPVRSAGVKVETFSELMDLLVQKEKVL